MHALFVHDPRFDLPCSVQVGDEPIGHGDLDWRDVSAVPGFAVGWVAYPDGRIGPYVPPLADARAHKLRELRADCSATIVGGLTSKALGASHRYGTSDSDRENIGRALRASLTRAKDSAWVANVPCRAEGDAADVFRPHGAAQIHALECDIHDFIEAQRLRLDGLKAKVAVALTPDQVATITW